LHAQKIALCHFVGIMFLIGGAMDVMMLPSPQWFSITDLAGAYFPMACLGYKFAEGKTNA